MAPQEQRHQQQYLAEGVVLPQHHDSSAPQKPVAQRRSSSPKQTSQHRALRVVPLVFLTAITYSLISWSFLSTASSGLLSQDHVHEGEVFLTQYMTTTASEDSLLLSTSTEPSLGLLDDHVLFASGIKTLAPFRLDNFGTGTLVNIKGTVRIQTTTTTSVLVKRKEVIDPRVGLVDKYCVGDDCTLSLQEAVGRIKELNTDASSSMWMQTVVPGATEYQWWLVDGHAVVVSTKCTGDNKDAYLTTDFEALLDSGCGTPPPELWNRMQEAVQQLHSSTGIARISISTTTGSVYVSTLVVSDDTSSLPLKLRLLLEGAREGHVAHAVLTPHHVERIVNDKSWALIHPAKTTSSLPTPTTHEDASSLCQEFTSHVIDESTAQCKADDYHALEQDFPIRCLSVDSNSQKISAVGQWRLPTFETVIVRVDWPWALGLFFLIVVLQLTNSNETLSRHRHAVPLTVLFYLAAVVVYKYIQPSNAGLFSPESISSTIMDSFYAFTVVHPMTSPWIALSHIFTYWFEVAAWRSKSVHGVLLWYLAYELGASYINEYMHITEHDTAIRCTRVSFVHGMKQYAVDDVVRAYLLPPFFVYLYLLPKLILQWVVPGGLEY